MRTVTRSGARGRCLAVLLCGLLAAPLILLPAGGARAAVPEVRGPVEPPAPRYFPETGHYVSGRFRQYWAAYGGLALFGLPLTDVFYEVAPDNGRIYLTQYFERARFEYHAGRTPPYDVGVTQLGTALAQLRPDDPHFRAAPDRQAPGGTFFASTGHNLAPEFAPFWRAHDGLLTFGLPRSEPFVEVSAADNRPYLVQYFERQRLEYHPEQRDAGAAILVGQLGRERLDRRPEDTAHRQVELAPPTGAPIPYGAGFYPVHSQPGELGVNAFLFGDGSPGGAAFNAASLTAARRAHLGWLRLQLVWGDFEPAPGAYDWAPLDARIAAAVDAGAQIVLSVTRAPAWAAPDHPGGLPSGDGVAAFGATMAAITGHYRGLVRAYEIWNEPNLASETGGQVDVAAYAATLRAGYDGVKAIDQSAVVLFGGLAPAVGDAPTVAVDPARFLEAFYALDDGATRAFDALGAHPYGAANPPEARYPDAPGAGACPPGVPRLAGTCYRDAPAYYFRQVEDLRALMVAHGDAAKQIWLTEFGWAACPGRAAPVDAPYCALVDEQQQAAYTVRAIAYARANWPWVGVLLLWNLNYAAIPGAPYDDKAAWSLLRPDGSSAPTLDALADLP